MEIKELISSLAKYDEMEAEDGMNLAEEVSEESNEEKEEVTEEVSEQKEEVDEAFVEDGLGKEKVVRSDLDFGIKAQIVDDGIYFGAVGFGPKAVIYRASDHVASEAELEEVQKRAVEAIEDAINTLEDKIIGIFNERGFRADAE